MPEIGAFKDERASMARAWRGAALARAGKSRLIIPSAGGVVRYRSRRLPEATESEIIHPAAPIERLLTPVSLIELPNDRLLKKWSGLDCAEGYKVHEQLKLVSPTRRSAFSPLTSH